MKSTKTKIIISLLGIAIVAASIGAAAVGIRYMRTLQSSGGFLEGTQINGLNVSGKSAAETAGLLTKEFCTGQVVLQEEGREVLRVSITDLGYQPDLETLEGTLTDLMKAQKENFRGLIDEILNGGRFETDIPFTVDQDVFDKIVKVKALSEPRRENRDAKILYYEDEGVVKVIPEVQGTKMHSADLRAWMRGALDAALTGQGGETSSDTKASEEKASEEESSGEKASEEDSSGEKSSREKASEEESSGEKSSREKASEEDSSGEKSSKEKASGEKSSGEKSSDASEKKEENQEAPEKPLAVKPMSLPYDKEKGFYEIVLSIPASLYIPPDKTVESGNLKEKCEILNSLASESVTYTFGSQTETLEFKTIMNWIRIKDGKPTVRENMVREYVEKLAERYETRYRDRSFWTTWGYEVTFSAGWNEYGYTILRDAEVEQLSQDILSGEKIVREPVYLYYNDWGCPLYLSRDGMDDLNGTYVEVSISAQHMWYYLNGQLFLETDVVTGDVTKDLGTSTGVFPLAFKESPSILRGGEGKDKYETEVQYWMPFYAGQGLHDAWWKTVFGGSEYKGDGSHGCVNLPPWAAETLYNNIVPGTAIVIYY